MIGLYGALLLGAVTTVYPFLLMAATGFKGPTDQNDHALIPKFWAADEELIDKYVDDKYAGDLDRIASTRIGDDASAEEVETYRAFLMDLPEDHWHAGFTTAPTQVTSKLNRRYQAWLKDKYGTIERLNTAYVELNAAFTVVAPPNESFDRRGWQPTVDAKWEDWLEFKEQLPAEYRVPIRAQRLYQDWLRAEYQGRFQDVPAEVKGDADDFTGIELPQDPPEAFVQEFLPERFASTSVEELWRQRAQGPMPIAAYEREFVVANAPEIRWEFSLRNYRYVLDYVLINGRMLVNTAVFCLLAVATQLIVNPLAAYALSRFQMGATAKILVFLLATMAFPAEVTMIPSFLLLKDLGLLNTFAALVLPTAASGYMIFLLKGFFDSLPREVFESGQMDGAPEWVMMLRLALPLSKPVLGYMALLAFMGAYGAFMYAFLVAQDQDMWTLMVFIYQLQQSAPKAVMMAAVTLAAVPTLVVFLFAQRVIMRGIVLPGER
jgi:multiple sugar transport system permease protein